MKAILKKNQYYVVSGLKRYREIAKQEMLIAKQNSRRLNNYIIARQKNKIYETLVSMVIYEGVDDTIAFALQLYAKLPHTPVTAKEMFKACERALESFFLLTDINTHTQQRYNQQRPATMDVTATEQTQNENVVINQYYWINLPLGA